MSNYFLGTVEGLFDPTTKALVGFRGLDGKEYLIGTSTAFATTQPSAYVPSSVAITGGSINGTSIGNSSASTVKTNALQANYGDSSSTPGNVTNSNIRGKAAFAVGTSSVTVTNVNVQASSTILVVLETSDATLTQILRATPGSNSFTVVGNANATAATTFSFQVIN